MIRVKVKPQDTIYNIAVKYNTSPSRIQIINNLYPPILSPGNTINVETPEQLMLSNHSFFVILASNNVEYPGTITLMPDQFIFEQRQLSLDAPKLIVTIDLISIIHVSILPHPTVNSTDIDNPSQPYILIISFLQDMLRNDSVGVVAFNSSKAELNSLHYQIIQAMERKRNDAKFKPTKKSEAISLKKTEEVGQQQGVPAPLRPRLVETQTFQVKGKSTVAKDVDIFGIRRELPHRFRSCNWKKIFDTSEDGTSFQGLFEKAVCSKATVILIKSSNDDRMGAFLPQGLKKSPRYYGTGDTFVFRLSGGFAAFHWSRENDSFVSASMSELMVGGGGGAAIWVDRMMQRGRSERCATFGSPPLASHSSFDIVTIELYDLSYT